jgi:hypothetical protein
VHQDREETLKTTTTYIVQRSEETEGKVQKDFRFCFMYYNVYPSSLTTLLFKRHFGNMTQENNIRQDITERGENWPSVIGKHESEQIDLAENAANNNMRKRKANKKR